MLTAGDPTNAIDLLESNLRRLDTELTRLAEAVASGGAVPPILEAIQARQIERQALLHAMEQAKAVIPVRIDEYRLRRDLRKRLTDWRGLLRRQVPVGQRVLKSLLMNKLVFTPHEDEKGQYYEFSGARTVEPVIRGLVPARPQNVASPPGLADLWTVEIRGIVRKKPA